MSNVAKSTRSNIVPCLRYRDAHAAIAWLCKAFGFQKHAVYDGPNNTVAHAQLTFGNGMIMVGSVDGESEWGKRIRQPDELEGIETQSAYVIVSDTDAVYQRARTAGAKILLEIKNEDYGGRGFTCADLEGHLWSFGSYDPWHAPESGVAQ